MTTELLTEAADSIIDATRQIVGRYRRWVNKDDVTQEMWLWVFEHPGTARRLLADNATYLTRRLVTMGERYARKEKAATEGYSPDDEGFYSPAVIRELLPDALDPSATPSQERQEVSVATSKDGYGGWEAVISDVRKALKTASAEDRELLTLRYRLGVTPDVMAQREGVTTDVIYGRLGRAVRRLQGRLGGPNPYTSGSLGSEHS